MNHTVKAWEDAGRPHPYATFRAGYDVAVANFLETTGQYVTNDATREAAIKEAVELDRQQRGEPVVWRSWNDRAGYGYWPTRDEAELNCAEEFEPEALGIIGAPQLAEPVVNQSLTTDDPSAAPLSGKGPFKTAEALVASIDSEPVKGEPSERTQPLLDMLETLCTGLEWNIENHPDVMNESDSEALHAARALLGRYQGAQPAASADPWRPSNAEALAWAERHLVENTLKGEAARCAIDDARSLHMLAAPIAAQPGMVSVARHDANNYCRILSALGMEEEGDPVAEVERLVAAQPSVPDFTEDLSKMCRRLILDVRALVDEEGPKAARLSRANQALKWLQSHGLAGSPLRDAPSTPAGEHPGAQAIRDAALEDAAAAAETYPNPYANDLRSAHACDMTAVYIGKRIRALKSQPAPSAQGREDAERLQWLESIGTVDIVHDLDGLVEIFDPNDVTLYATGSTLRAAIDTARAAKERNHG